MMTTRETFVRSLAAAAAAAVAGTAAAARADDAPLRIGAIPIDNGAEPFYAQDQGLFKKAGLDVEVSVFPSGGAAAAALAGGAIDVGIIDAVSMASAHAHGIPISYVFPATIQTVAAPAYAVLVGANAALRTGKDFAGKIVAVNGLKNILQIPFMAWVANTGGDPSTIKFIEVPFAAMAGSIESGTIDAASISEPFITNAMATGKFRVIPQTEHGLASQFAFSGWTVQNDWAAKNPDPVKKFVSAMQATATWANANHEISGQILLRNSKMSPDIIGKLARARYGEKLLASDFQPVYDAAARFGVIPKSFPAAETFIRS
jgi:NitT/TauT family transport system substrate-binding protein